MTYVFKNLKADIATFEDFREEFQKHFDYDYYETTDEEDIPTGLIKASNDEFIHAYQKEEFVELWMDDNDNEVVELD